ncbi:MAG: hypothetical protein IKR13_04460 [Victivallales bacterium]|nr:hypothetical protein [Victivallales bacterium]
MHKLPSDIVEQVRKCLDPIPCGLVRRLVEAGYEAYIVGGAIRDLLLGVSPKDYDIATSATPEEIRAVFGRRRCHIIGRRFRLVHVFANGDHYEVSTFRRVPSEKERHGRHPDADDHIIWNDNCFGTLEDDVTRRDFTANSLYFDVVGKRGVIDFWNGYQDIRDRVVRCIGKPSERMEEDPVRMLRALKLAGQFGFQLEPELAEAIHRQAAAIRLASPSRLFEELLKILKHPAADQTLLAMHNHGFLKHFWNLLDAAWDEQEGLLTRHLLKLRGEAILRGHYSNSRGLALSTVSLPFFMTAMNPEHPTDFWNGSLTYNPIAHRALDVIFEGFQLPNAFAHRILNIVGLVPRLLNHTPQILDKLLHHEEYRYGRALLALLVQAFGWDSAKNLGSLPEFSPSYGNWLDEPEEPIVSGEESESSEQPSPIQPITKKRERRPKVSSPPSTSLPDHSEESSLTPPPPVEATPSPASPPLSPPTEATPGILPLRKDTSTPAKPRKSAAVSEETKISRKSSTSTASEKPVKAMPKRLVALRKDGRRMPLPSAEDVTLDSMKTVKFPACSAGKVEFGTSFVMSPSRKHRSPTETESITFSPNRKSLHHKRPSGGKVSEI